MKFYMPFVAGALLRKSVIFELKKAAYTMGLEFDYQEERGWLESFFHVWVTGDEKMVMKYSKIATKWLKENER